MHCAMQQRQNICFDKALKVTCQKLTGRCLVRSINQFLPRIGCKCTYFEKPEILEAECGPSELLDAPRPLMQARIRDHYLYHTSVPFIFKCPSPQPKMTEGLLPLIACFKQGHE
ncbi:hypothetical protein AAC387_Pa06g1413 [Persea americana]